MLCQENEDHNTECRGKGDMTDGMKPGAEERKRFHLSNGQVLEEHPV